ncbi:MAG: GxxExxY protein [Nitrospinae bacterium]|nr:GxxExxY protein [Nitrospinota bacterium]
MNADKLQEKETTEIILKCFYEVYNELGHGFLESIYEKAMCIALKEYGLDVETQKEISVSFRGNIIGNFRADLIVNHSVIIELKAARSIDTMHEAQLLNYLKATPIEIGLLLNFGKKPEFKRFIFDNSRKK